MNNIFSSETSYVWFRLLNVLPILCVVGRIGLDQLLNNFSKAWEMVKEHLIGFRKYKALLLDHLQCAAFVGAEVSATLGILTKIWLFSKFLQRHETN